MRLVFLGLILGFSSCFAAATLEERILQEREARLKALDDRDQGSGMDGSSLSGIGQISRQGIELIDPAAQRASFSLKDAIRLALEHAPELKAAQSTVRASEIQANAAGRLHRPDLDFITGWNNADTIGNDSRNEATRKLFDVTRLENSFHAGLEFSMPIYDAGLSSSERRSARLEAELQEVGMKLKKQDLILKTARNFIDQMVLIEEIQALEYRREAQELEISNLERENSDPAFPDKILEARLVHDSLMQNEQEKRDSLLNLQVRFRQLLDLEPGQDFFLKKNAPTKILTESREGIQEIARSFSMELKQVELELLKSKEHTDQIHSSRQPMVDLLGKTTYARTNDRFKTDEMRWMLGVEMDLNILDGGRTRARQSTERENLSRLKAEEEKAQDSLDLKLEDHFQRMNTSRRQLEEAIRRLELARGLLFEAEARFERRQLGFHSILKIREQHKLAVHSYYLVLGRMILAKLNLFALMGKLDLDIFG